MIKVFNSSDAQAARNIDNVLALYEQMINKKDAQAAVQRFLDPGYIQHNPLVPDGPKGLGATFAGVAAARQNPRVIVHRIIAAGEWVWAHVNFVNLYSDDPNDRGIAGVDIYRMNNEGKAIEHWDVLQPVPDPARGAHANPMF